MNFSEVRKKIESYIENKKYDEAREEIYKLLKTAEIKEIENEESTYLCFNSYIELMLYVDKYKPTKKNTAPKTNMAYLYYILGFIDIERKQYEDALKNLNESLKWNPIDLTVLFERAEIYKAKGDLERFKAEIEKTYAFITSNYFLARYYREIGYYYIEKKIYDVANAIYSMAFDFAQTEQEKKKAINELMYIAQQENREMKKTELEEIIKICEDYNITIGFNKRTVGILLNEHKRLMERDGISEQVKDISRVLYEITQDIQFMITNRIKDEETGISILVPENWGVLRKSEFEKMGLASNTIFVLKTKYNEIISIVVENGECGIGQFTEMYRVAVDDMKKAGITLLAEFSNRFDDGFKLRQAIVEVKRTENGGIKIENDKVKLGNGKARIIQNFIRVNNKLVNISWEIPKEKEPKEMIELINNGIAMQVILSISGDKDKKADENLLTKAKNFVYSQNIWKTSLEKLEEEKGFLCATQWEMKQRIDTAEEPYINPAFLEELNNITEEIKEIDNMIEWNKYLEDVSEMSVTIGRNIYRIKTDVIKHFSSDNTMLGTRNISTEEFKRIVFNTLCYMYDWKKSYIGKELVDGMNWSILIKSNKYDMKRFSGNNSYPITWSEFYDNFVYAIEKSDITFFDGTFIKSLIYLVIATQEEKDQNLITCMHFVNNLELEQIMQQLPVQHPARVLFKTLDSLTDMQYAKLLIETKDILAIFIQDFQKENENILLNISSEQDVDKVVSKIMEHFKNLINGGQCNYDIMDTVIIAINEKYKRNGISQDINVYIRIFVENIIENNKQDKFWSDSAREFLALLILSNLVQNQEISLEMLKEQTKEIENTRKLIKENLEKYDEIPEIQEFLGVTKLLDSDKPFKSLVEISHESLEKYKEI